MIVKPKIQSVRLIGVTNQIVDTKLHAFLNWQEYIQANVYSFYVTFENGSHKTIQTSKKNEVSYYMSFIDNNIANKSSIDNNIANVSNSFDIQGNTIDQLEKLKRLFDLNVIDEETYNKQRIVLVNRVNGNAIKENDTNIHIGRDKPKASGEAKMFMYIDGKKNAEVESQIDLHMNEGIYTIWFQRMALSSNKLTIRIERNVKYNISVKVGMFSLKTAISELRDGFML